MITAIVFYIFASILLCSAVVVVSARNPVVSVLFLILCFFNASGLFLMMGAEFLAFSLLIVYVGAVAVLFLFVVMMLDIDLKAVRTEFRRFLPVGGLVTAALLAQLVLMAAAWKTDARAIKAAALSDAAVDNTRALGRVMFTDYFFPFQVCGFILLTAMIGAIVLTLRDRKDARRQKSCFQKDIAVSDVVEIRKVQSGKGVAI